MKKLWELLLLSPLWAVWVEMYVLFEVVHLPGNESAWWSWPALITSVVAWFASWLITGWAADNLWPKSKST